MTDRVIMVVKPVIHGLDGYMDKVEKLSSLLSEAMSVYDELKDVELEVGYEVEQPTLNS